MGSPRPAILSHARPSSNEGFLEECLPVSTWNTSFLHMNNTIFHGIAVASDGMTALLTQPDRHRVVTIALNHDSHDSGDALSIFACSEGAIAVAVVGSIGGEWQARACKLTLMLYLSDRLGGVAVLTG